MDKEKHSLSESARHSLILGVEHLQNIKSVPQAGLEWVKKYLAEGHKQRGRPHGTGKDDDQHVRRMMEYLRTGEAKNPHDAAQKVAREIGGDATHGSVVRRLLKKFRETPPDE